MARAFTYEYLEENLRRVIKERDMFVDYCERLTSKVSELEATNAALSWLPLEAAQPDEEDRLP